MDSSIPAATDNTPRHRPTAKHHLYIPDHNRLSCSFCGLPAANHRHTPVGDIAPDWLVDQLRRLELTTAGTGRYNEVTVSLEDVRYVLLNHDTHAAVIENLLAVLLNEPF